MNPSLFKSYGDALFSIAREKNQLEAYRVTCNEVRQTLNDELMSLLSHPKISKNEKKEIISSVYKEVDPMILNFMKLMIDKNHGNHIKDAIHAFDKDYREYKEIEIAHVYSAVELSEAQKEELQSMLCSKENKAIECEYAIDSSLIAGLRIRIKDQVYDNSAFNRLTRLKNEVMRSTY